MTAALYVLVGISLTATAPFHSAMAMELQQHGVALNYGLSRGLGSAFGNFVSGQLLDRTGVNGMLLFCTICAAVGLLVVIYAVRKK